MWNGKIQGTEQEKQRPLSLYSQDNNIQRDEGLGRDFLVLFWSISKGPSLQLCLDQEERQRKNFSKSIGCYWIKDNTSRILLYTKKG